ncbi:MAG: MFS transporter, partial [Micromonosporaceae bacterium]|nr:MFS transporter [Micromonosporaceae bacterium]
MRAGLTTVFGSLKVRNFRLFVTGQLVKLIGVWAQFITQDWLVLQLSDNSATALGIATALQFLPVLLLSLYAGRLADRYDKRKLLIWVNAAFAVAACALGVLVMAGAVALWHV